MSQMQTPYESSNVNLYQEPERTSIMAILSLVLGLLGCCTFVTAPIGLLLGALGIVGIIRSKGRVGGTGLAIGGIIVAILAMAIWLGIVFGFGGMMKVMIQKFGGTTETILTDAQNGDYDSVRNLMLPPASEVSDEQIAEFNAALTNDLGAFVGLPDSLGEMFRGYMDVGPLIQTYNGRPGYVPMPVRFDSGWVLVMYVMDPSGQSGSGSNGMPSPEKLILVGPDGKEYTLPPNAGDHDSVNSEDPGATLPEIPGDSGQDPESPSGEPADEPGEDSPEGP